MKLTLGQVADWIHAEGDFDDVAGGGGVFDRFADDRRRESCSLR